MNEILQQRIEEAAHQYIQSDAVAPENMQLAFGDFINGAMWALQNQWVSVEEALPPLDDGMESISIEVVVKNEYGKATCAWYSYITNTWHLSYGEIAGDDVIDSKITHWMLIPSLKGGEK